MDSTTLYQRIAETIRADILEGRLRPGDRLPSIRELTRTWACTPGTVQRAYQELTRQSLVVSQPGKGTHVAGGIDTRLIQAQGPLRTALLVNRSEAFLLELLTGGFEPGEIAQAFELALDRWHALKRLNTPPEQLVLRFHGSHDQAVTWIASHFNHIAPNWEMELTFSGSLNGLMALAEGRAEVAGCHLLDVETGSYNLPFLSKLFPGKHMAAIRLAERSIGLILPAGNPQRLAGLHDLTRPGLRFA
ncbi:MAG: GntR family transcriptional regulator, partial [Anaerolineae bacterium]|nr:GntR family transcriptional regulator [Anaerolineae bacterium]